MARETIEPASGVTTTSNPPGRRTRHTSRTSQRGSSRCSITSNIVTTSKVSSLCSRLSTRPCRTRVLTCSLAHSTACLFRSTPHASQPASAATSTKNPSPHPLRRHHHPPEPGLPPLLAGRRPHRRDRGGALGGRRGRVVPLVRLRHVRGGGARRRRRLRPGLCPTPLSWWRHGASPHDQLRRMQDAAHRHVRRLRGHVHH